MAIINLKNFKIQKYMIFKNLKISLFFLITLFTFQINFSRSSIQDNKKEEKSFLKKNDFFNNSELRSYYLLGPGDVLKLTYTGLDIFSSTYQVDQSGFLKLPELEEVYVEGKTIYEVKNKLEELYEKYIVEPDIEISILAQRPIRFFLGGEVNIPGIYTSKNATLNLTNTQNISITPRLYDAIQKGKGLTNYADLSKVRIVRKNAEFQGGGKISTTVNLLSLLTDGDHTQNIKIFDGDSIFIPKSKKPIRDQILALNRTNLTPDTMTIYITGNVSKKGPVILSQGSSLVQAIASTGGKKLLTGDVVFTRFNKDGTMFKKKFRYSSNALINTTENPILMNGDVIHVNKTLLGNATEVFGELSSPILSGIGLYEIFN